MPAGNLAQAVVSPQSTVLPKNLCTSFVESNLYPILTTDYHDGTRQMSLIQDGINAPESCRMWKLARRLDNADLTTLRTFFETTVMGGYSPFWYYDPYEPATGQPIGSNWDGTGFSTQGRVCVVFRGNWKDVIDLGRAQIPELMLVQTA
jgi:hypothetical protein